MGGIRRLQEFYRKGSKAQQFAFTNIAIGTISLVIVSGLLYWLELLNIGAIVAVIVLSVMALGRLIYIITQEGWSGEKKK